jgi:hypothetical protein
MVGAPLRWRGPVPGHHAAVPSQQGLGRDHEDRPSGPEQQTTERRKQGAVLGLEPRAWVLAAQDCQLVAEDQDLDLLASVDRQHHQLQDTRSAR